jgi:hypothetical protein
MRVYLGGDPAKGGKVDVAGARDAYSQFFGTKDQPNKPACTTVQMMPPAAERGSLIEIDLVALRRFVVERPKGARRMRRASGHGRPHWACAQHGLRSAMPRVVARGVTHALRGLPGTATQGLGAARKRSPMRRAPTNADVCPR